MIKFKQGFIKNREGDVTDIVVKSLAPNNIRDALIGGSIITAGIIYLTYTAFRNGALAFEVAEFQAMMDAKVIPENYLDDKS